MKAYEIIISIAVIIITAFIVVWQSNQNKAFEKQIADPQILIQVNGTIWVCALPSDPNYIVPKPNGLCECTFIGSPIKGYNCHLS